MIAVKPLKPSTHYIFWSIITICFITTVLLLKAVLLPFVVGIVVAYILNPAVNKLGKWGINRAFASLIILGVFLAVLLSFIAIISPVLARELSAFIKDVPDYINQLIELAKPLTTLLEKYTGEVERSDIEGFLIDNSKSATALAGDLAGRFIAGGQVVIDIISFMTFMPIVAYFMMKEWPKVTQWVYDLIPCHAKDDIMELIKQINIKLSGFIRGQISVAIVLAITYAMALTLAGLKYGLMIGLMAGILSIIPMVGSFIGLVVSVGVAWFQLSEWTYVLLIAAIFLGGQLIEGNFLTPKLVGQSVGLHPLWVFFALLAGGSLLGVLGMLLAVPIAAIIGVLLSFGLKKYKQSAYYQGTSKTAESTPAKQK